MSELRGFIGPTYTLRSVNLDCQRTVNLYPEINELQTSPTGTIGALVTTPGLRLLGTCGTGPIRCIYVASSGGMIVVSGSEVYKSTSSFVFSKIGDINTKTGPVSAADNGSQIMLVDGTYGYIVTISTGNLAQITNINFPGANTVTYQDGYFICNNPGTGQFFISSLYDGFTWDALNFASAEGSPDNVVAVLSNQRQLWIAGAQTMEVWWDSGQTFAFSRIDGAFIEYGCLAAQSLKKYGNTVIWLGAGVNAHGCIFMAQGYVPKRISNHSVEVAIQSYGDLSTATAYVYEDKGHVFYCINFPTADRTWAYDLATGQWHERCYLGSNGNFERHRGECYAYGFNTHVLGDYVNGNIYAMDDATYDDNGNPKKWMRRAPDLIAGGKRVFYPKAQLFARVGTSLQSGASNATNATVELRYSDDFGHSWSNPKAVSLGLSGEYAKRVIWRQLGSSRQRVFEVSGSDPVEVALIGFDVDATPGAS